MKKIYESAYLTNQTNMNPQVRQWIKAGVAATSIIGTGVLLYNTTVPTDEQLIAKFSPEVRAEYERNRDLRQEEQRELMKIVQKTSASNDPVWKTGPIKSPFEKDGKNQGEILVSVEDFHQKKAEEYKKKQAQEAEQAYTEAEELANSLKKKSWYKFW